MQVKSLYLCYFANVKIVDGIAKLPDPLVAKLIQYDLFDPELCAFTAAKMNMNGQHTARSFVKTKTTIATQYQVPD